MYNSASSVTKVYLISGKAGLRGDLYPLPLLYYNKSDRLLISTLRLYLVLFRRSRSTVIGTYIAMLSLYSSPRLSRGSFQRSERLVIGTLFTVGGDIIDISSY